MKNIIEVGASGGSDTMNFLKNPENLVYAFEPVPQEMMLLWQRLHQYPNINLINAAVTDKDGWFPFNITPANAGVGHSASSLLDFRDPTDLSVWNRPDFNTMIQIRIPCFRLDTFMNAFSIDEVEYLWCDAQGMDLHVLRGLGDRYVDVKQGRCEVCFKGNEIYKNQENVSEDVVKFLQDRGFKTEVTNVHHVGGLPAEGDVLFWRS